MVEKVHKYLLLGSCFAQNMGAKLLDQGIPAMVNPLGTLYNPESIRQTILASLPDAVSQIQDGTRDMMFWDSAMQEWRCWIANTQFKNTDRQALRNQICDILDSVYQWIQTADRCVITLGTNVCYRLADSGFTVTNCQRQPDRLFIEYRMTLDECTSSLQDTLQMLWDINPDIHVTLTVSPYRYRKYGLHGSQLSKATLLLAEDNIVQRFPDRVSYFPSYEIMMDELRDYRYYTQDTFHPSAEAVEIIWRRFNENQ